jgi:hypothetical protein
VVKRPLQAGVGVLVSADEALDAGARRRDGRVERTRLSWEECHCLQRRLMTAGEPARCRQRLGTGQKGLADPRFARHLDRARTALIQLVENLLERSELVGTPHEVPGKQPHTLLFLASRRHRGALRHPGRRPSHTEGSPF